MSKILEPKAENILVQIDNNLIAENTQSITYDLIFDDCTPEAYQFN